MATTAPGAAPAGVDDLALVDAWWRAGNYLSVGQIYLLANPLLREPLTPEHVKPRLLGHWGTTPGPQLGLRAPQPGDPRRDLEVIYLCGPGHGGPAHGGQRLPGGHLHRDLPPRHPRRRGDAARCSASSPTRAASPATPRPRHPGSIHEGGELGYSLAHAYGAALDNPDLLAWRGHRRRRGRDRRARRLRGTQQVPQPGDGRRGAARSCTSTATRSPTRPCWAARPRRRAGRCSRGYGYDVLESRATTPPRSIRTWRPRSTHVLRRHRPPSSGPPAAVRRHRAPPWPMIVLRTPQGLDRSRRRRRRADGGHLAVPPGAAGRRCGRTAATSACWRSGCAVLPARGAVRRRRPAAARGAGPSPDRPAADERHPPRQRRAAHARPRPARLPRLRGRRTGAGDRAAESDPPGWASWLRDVVRRQPGPFPAVLAPRDQSNRLGAVSRSPTGRVAGGSSTPTSVHLARGPGDGGAVRAQLPGVAGGLHC